MEFLPTASSLSLCPRFLSVNIFAFQIAKKGTGIFILPVKLYEAGRGGVKSIPSPF